MRILEGFRETVAHLDWPSLVASGDSTYLLDRGLRLAGWNEAYAAFALANGGDDVEVRFPLGSPVLAAVSGPLVGYYERLFTAALAEGDPVHRDYECSSPEEERFLHMSVYPIHGGAGLVVSHHVIHRAPHSGPDLALRPHHTSPLGFIVQCSNCRKIRDHRTANKWDWVPAVLVREPANLSHSICPNCLDHYYADFDEPGAPEAPGSDAS